MFLSFSKINQESFKNKNKNKTFYFEIGLHALIRNNTERSQVPITLYLPMVTVCKKNYSTLSEPIVLTSIQWRYRTLPSVQGPLILPFYSYTHFFFKSFYCYSITVVCIFSPPLHPTPSEPPSLPHLHPPPWFCPCVLYSSSCNPLSPLCPPHSPLAIVRLFLTLMSLVIFCLLFSFVDYVLIIFAVAKGISSFFISAT